MAPGPPPTPAKLLKLTGSWRAKTRKNEPKLANREPGYPTWLSKEAKAEWKRVMPQLKQLSMAAAIGRSMFAVYCETWADYVEAARAVRAKGKTYMNAKGNIVAHPMVSILNQTRKAFLQFAQEFGLGPAARTRIGVEAGGPKNGDAFDEFMRPKT